MASFASVELEAGWSDTERRLDELVEVVAGRSAEELNWRPAAPEANSLYVLTTHTIASTGYNLLGLLCGGDDARDREAEIRAAGESTEPLEQMWRELRTQLGICLSALPPERLDKVIEHPQHGPMTVREILLLMVTHTAEHLGQAELTRDLLVAGGA